jgi:hypothetical protein
MTSVYMYTLNSSKCLSNWRKYGKAPDEFLSELKTYPKSKDLLWRGTSLRSVDIISASPVLSTSTSLAVAKRFSKGAIIAFYGFEGYSISSSSFYQNEDEVLLLPQQHEVRRLAKGIFLAMPTKLWQNEEIVSNVEIEVLKSLGITSSKIINYKINNNLWVTGPLP